MLCHYTLSILIDLFELRRHSSLLSVVDFAGCCSTLIIRALIARQRGRVVGVQVLHLSSSSCCFRRWKCLFAWVAHFYRFKIHLGRVIVVVLEPTFSCSRSYFIDWVKSARYTLDGLLAHPSFQNILQLLVLRDLSPWMWQDFVILNLLLDAILPVLSLWLLGDLRCSLYKTTKSKTFVFLSFLHHKLINKIT